ncbi:dihydrolipoyl dehydrogenase 1, mitochondrial precursor, partial [Thraustotheca clavata]
MGSVYGRLGAKITVVEYADKICPSMDAETGREFQKLLKKQGMDFKLSHKVTASKVEGDKVTLTVEPSAGGEASTIECDTVLVATGRRPFTNGLGLEDMGIQTDKFGRIKVDLSNFKTNVDNIYAIGDCIEGAMLAHKAEEEGISCVETIAGGHGHVNYDAIPGVVYTFPEVATVGKTEEELKAASIAYNVGKFPMMANSRARTVGETDGFVKILAAKEDDKILGIHIIASNAGEMISEGETNRRFLVYGGTGWIGQKIIALLQENQEQYHVGLARLENRQDLWREIKEFKPTNVINAAGVTGRPNVDWCETHQEETIRANVLGCLNLVDVCSLQSKPIHCTVIGSGCIFTYDELHPIGSENMFTEEDISNFDGSFYAKTKAMLEVMLRSYSNVCLLRFRMPISDDLHPRSLLTKLIHYPKVINIPNSITVLTDLLPAILILAKKQFVGVYNFTNPGVIAHNELLNLYIQYIDPSYQYTNFDAEAQKELCKSRSNVALNSTKLQSALGSSYKVPNIQDSIHRVFQRMQMNLAKEEKGNHKITQLGSPSTAKTSTHKMMLAAARSSAKKLLRPKMAAAFSTGHDYDLVVVGGGPGGYVAAIKAAQLGLKTACVESRGTLGGTCLNVGCIPSKALLSATHKYHAAQHEFKNVGIEMDNLRIDFDKLMKSKDKSVKILTGGIEGLFKKNKVDYIKGFGKIVAKNQLSVALSDGGNKTVSTKNILIATGSEVTPLPPVPVDNEAGKIIDSTGALSLKRIPEHLVVIGGG